MRARPWFGEAPVIPGITPVGMLGGREASLCYHLTRDAFTGQGTIVDAGSFLGKSAYFFAQGLAANPRYTAGTHRIHCFDNFLVNEEATIRFIREYLSRSLSVGDSTRAIFDLQVAAVKSMLEIHEGDFHVANWSGEPIEILMVDIAKNEALGKRVAEIFFSNLIPGVSLVIQQDYHHPWLPHIHVTMEYLADYFELVSPRVDDSAVFLLREPIPDSVLARAIKYDFNYEERLNLIGRAIERLAPEDRYYVQLARIVLQCGTADVTLLRRELEVLEDAFSEGSSGYSQNPYFEDVRSYIDELDGWRQMRGGNYAGALSLADALLKRRATSSALIMRGRALTGLGRYVEAEHALREAMQSGRRPTHAYVELARALLHQRRFDEAEAELLESMCDREAMGSHARTLLPLLAAILIERNDRAKADQTLARLLQDYPNHAEVWATNARILFEFGDTAGAEAASRKASGLGFPGERLEELRRPHTPVSSAERQDSVNSEVVAQATSVPTPAKPWKSVFLPPSVTSVPSMLNFDEQQYLTWLTHETYEGFGAIVELGCWLGASTVALAEGLRRRGSPAVIHSVDRFIWEPYMEAASHAGLETGADFLPRFLQEIGEYTGFVRPMKMDLLSARWSGGPIEILFMDSAKDWDTVNVVLQAFGPHLVPGRSRVVVQDFRYPWAHCLPLIFDSRPDLWKQIASGDDGDGATFLLLKPLDGPVGTQAYSEEGFPAASAEHLFRARMEWETPLNRARLLKGLYRKLLIEGMPEAADVRQQVISAGATASEMAIVEDVEVILVPRGWRDYERGDFVSSRRCAERCLGIPEKRSIHALTLLGFSLLRSGEIPAAEACMNEVLSISPGFSSAKLFRAELDLNAGKPDSAEQETLDVLTSGPLDETTTRWALNLLSQALARSGHVIDPETLTRLSSMLAGKESFKEWGARHASA